MPTLVVSGTLVMVGYLGELEPALDTSLFFHNGSQASQLELVDHFTGRIRIDPLIETPAPGWRPCSAATSWCRRGSDRAEGGNAEQERRPTWLQDGLPGIQPELRDHRH